MDQIRGLRVCGGDRVGGIIIHGAVLVAASSTVQEVKSDTDAKGESALRGGVCRVVRQRL